VSDRFVWPDRDAIVDALSDFMAEYGHSLRIRDAASLDAAFSRVEQYFNYARHADAAQLAAVMFASISQRHPLVDGNKRLAWLAATIFLDMNGSPLDAREYEAFEQGMALIEKRISLEDFAAFLRANLLPHS
jgi:death-on-curing protein